jgi:hypothetical protein
MTTKINQNGVSLIAAIFLIIVLAFMGVMFVSLINTGSFTSVNDMQSAQALYVAEGGVELAQYSLAQNLDWYRSASDPMPAPASTTNNLGAGLFTVSTTLPATKLSKRLQTGDNTAYVYSTGRFPPTGYLQIEDTFGVGGAEFVSYTGILGNTFTGLTAINRGVTIGTIGALASAHARGSMVYPVTTLTLAGGLPASCLTPTTFTIGANLKLLSAGTLDIEGEEITYSGSSTSGVIMTLTGVQRCRDNTTPITSASHAQGQPVTPVLEISDSANYEAEIASAGTAGSAARTVRKTVQR